MAQIIIEDIGNKDKQHELKHQYWESNSVLWKRYPLPVGDYILYNDLVGDVIQRKSKRGISIKKMDFLGTYKVCVDTKKNIQELVSNICGKQHERFRDECILAQNNGIKLYILVENKGEYITRDIANPTICRSEDLHSWKNPRLFVTKPTNEVIGYYANGKPKYKRVQKYPKATKGQTLMKACMSMQEKYGVTFLFCRPEESGKRVLEILQGDI